MQHISFIVRSAVPAHSFRYGQAAAFDGLDVPDDAWCVATDCTHFDADENMSDVLVVHFIYSKKEDAENCARQITDRHVTVIAPVDVRNARTGQ